MRPAGRVVGTAGVECVIIIILCVQIAVFYYIIIEIVICTILYYLLFKLHYCER
jgi:uncharacterized membrane protein